MDLAGRLNAVFAAGVGETTPPALTGAVDARDSANRDAFQRTYLGDIRVSVASAQLPTNLVGAYELSFVVPELTGDGKVLRWYSRSRGGAGLVRTPGASTSRYMAVPTASGSVQRLDMNDLGPHFVAVSGMLDGVDSGYKNLQLLDLRRDMSESPSHGVLRSSHLPMATRSTALSKFQSTARRSPHLASRPKAVPRA